MLFPLHFRPKQSYHEAPRSFGSRRDHGNRLHAGCDLYTSVGTPILAVADGTVLQAGPFYDGTWSVVVDHDDFVVRYGEVKPHLPKEIKPGASVKRGQVVAYVGHLKHLVQAMLHFEMYSGDTDGSLTDRSNKPYMRRSDLIDPTPYLDAAVVEAGGAADTQPAATR
jgi:murein DD-endopeptidase MepM/ murein hydrolase activator NlpD